MKKFGLKRIIAIMMLGIMVVSICGCGNKSNGSDFTMWKQDGVIKEVKAYVEDVTNEKSSNFIPVADRVAVFDLDGTLVGEQFPIYFEWLMYAKRVLSTDSLRANPEMRAVAEDIIKAAEQKSIPEGLEERESVMFGKAFDKMTTEEYRNYVKEFLSQSADGFDNLTFGDAYFRPMTEIIAYLQKNGFKIYICSGTDRDADRVMVQGFSDIPNYQVIGSDYYTEGANHDGVNYLDYHFASDEKVMRDDSKIIKNVKASKIVQLSQEIGQKPVIAFGNSNGDTSMFTYTTYDNPYKSAAFCIVPDDNEREYAYPDRVEKLTNTCKENGWHTISMKDDFLTIYGENVKKNEKNTAFLDSLKSLMNK